MVDEGLFDLFPCDIIFGIPNMPGLEKGNFYFKEGAMMASCDTVHIEINGKGSHGAIPERGVDATLTASYISTALQTIISRNITPFEPAVITIGSIQSGNAPNIVNHYALMQLSVRSLDNNIRKQLLQQISETATEQAKSFGAETQIKHVNECPVLINGKEATQFTITVTEELFGKEKIHIDTQALMGSKDRKPALMPAI